MCVRGDEKGMQRQTEEKAMQTYDTFDINIFHPIGIDCAKAGQILYRPTLIFLNLELH